MSLKGWKLVLAARRQIIAIIVALVSGTLWAKASPGTWAVIQPYLVEILTAFFAILAIATGVNDVDVVALANKKVGDNVKN